MRRFRRASTTTPTIANSPRRRRVAAPALSLLGAAALTATALVATSPAAHAAAGTAANPAATASSLAALFTNAGISDDVAPAAANLDGGGYSLSAEALAAVGWAPGAAYTLADGATVQVPNLAPGQADNALANGQTFALGGGGSRLDFIATSTDGATSGGGTITYTDGTTQAYTLAVPDWFTGTAGFAAQTAYRNGPSGPQAHQINLFDSSVALTAGKTVASVTLPTISSTAVNTAALHVFAAVVAPASGATGLSAAFNNVGITDNAATTAGNMDGSGQTLSAQALAAAGWTPGARVVANGTTLAWPDLPPGVADNVVANGQRIAVGGSGDAVSFLVTSTGAATSGSGTIAYTDGSTQAYSLAAPDWYTGPTDTMAVQLPSWNTQSGNQSAAIKLYAVTVPLNPAKTLASVTLPAVSAAPGPTTAALHVFALGVRQPATAWSGTWAAAADDGLVNGPWTNRTLRMVEHSSVGGSTARIRLDNAFGTAPAVIGHATIAVQASASSATAAPVTLTFNGNRSATIPAGGQLVSDPVGFALPSDANLLVSLFLPGPVQLASFHSLGMQDMYSTADQAGDHTADVANYPVNNTFGFWTLLSGSTSSPRPTPGPWWPSATPSPTAWVRLITTTTVGPTTSRAGCSARASTPSWAWSTRASAPTRSSPTTSPARRAPGPAASRR